MEACPRCNTPWNEQGYCPNDGTLRQSGVTIGDRYELEQVIGSGGMGIVYAGRHKLLGKGVAIKVLRSDLTSDATQVARFLREAQLCSQMQHDNIVDITDFGRDTSGSLYIAMELLTGTSLAAVLEQEGPMSVERAIPILRQVCRALDCAHRAGVVHRDLTPRNVFLTQQSGRSDVVKLLDFGFSRMVQSEDRITSTGIPLGTTAYMPPEQLRGESTQNQRVDIYALGVMAFQMLTGTLPFEQKTPALLITEKLSTDAKGRITTQLGQRYPGLAQLISECVSRDADQRPSSAVEVEQRLLSSPGAEVSQNENLSGLRAGSYRLVRLLGSGGLGSVLAGRAPGHRLQGRDQGAAPSDLRVDGRGAQVRGRGADGQPYREPEHRPHLRLRQAPRRARLRGDGAPRGRDPPGEDGAAGPLLLGRGDAAGLPDRPGPPRGTSGGGRSPRPEAGQRVSLRPARVPDGEDPRLRHREAPR